MPKYYAMYSTSKIGDDTTSHTYEAENCYAPAYTGANGTTSEISRNIIKTILYNSKATVSSYYGTILSPTNNNGTNMSFYGTTYGGITTTSSQGKYEGACLIISDTSVFYQSIDKSLFNWIECSVMTGKFKVIARQGVPLQSNVSYISYGKSGTINPIYWVGPFFNNYTVNGESLTYNIIFNYRLDAISSASMKEIFFYKDFTSNLNYSSKVPYVGDIIELDNTIVTPEGLWYLQNCCEQLFDNTYTIKSLDGEEILSTLEEAPPMVQATLTYGTNNATIDLVGSNGKTYTLNFTVPTIENYMFTGLSLSPNYKGTPLIPSNGETVTISLESSTNLYLTFGYHFKYNNIFNLNLLNSSAEPNRVDKTTYLTEYGTLNGVLRNTSSIFNPTFIIEMTETPLFNYVYISIWKRYYFVEDISTIKNNLWQIELTCDVLMSFKEAIQDLECIVDRQEFEFNDMLVDTQIPTQANSIIEYDLLEESPFNTVDATDNLGKSYVLTVIGGKN